MKNKIRTKGGSCQSELEADEWRKMLTSKVFDNCISDLRKAIFGSTKHTSINEFEFQNNKTSLNTYIASGLMPLHS